MLYSKASKRSDIAPVGRAESEQKHFVTRSRCAGNRLGLIRKKPHDAAHPPSLSHLETSRALLGLAAAVRGAGRREE